MSIPFLYAPLPPPLPPWLCPLLPPHHLLHPWPLKRPNLPLISSLCPVEYIPRFLRRPDEGLVDGLILATTVYRYMDALTNVDEFDDLQMLTSIFNSVFGDMIWSSR